LQCQTSCQNFEVDKFCDQSKQYEIKQTENLIQSNKHLDDTNIIDKGENVLHPNDTNISISATKSKIASNSDTTEKNIPTLEREEDTILYESNDKDAANLCLQPDTHLIENDGKYNLNTVSLNGSSAMQKEHLLEMASEVANVLTDNTDHTEPTLFDLDLKCRNQFLSTCLEEQKQLVNDLHVQVSRYVSIVHYNSYTALLYSII